MQNLPPELLHEIISHLDTEPPGHDCGPHCPAASNLHSLSLTSRAFHQFANPVLYAHDAAHAGQAILLGAYTGNTDIIAYSQSLGGDVACSRPIRLPGYSEMATGTPLHVAVREGRATMVEFLVARGANMNATGMGLCACSHDDHPFYPCAPWSPLHLALCRNRPEIAEHLILRGASLVTSREDQPPSRAPRRNGSVALLRPFRGVHALDDVSKTKDIRMLRFIMHHAGQGIESARCNRPLRRIARVTDDPVILEFMDTLLNHGAELYPPGFRGGQANGRVPLDSPFIQWVRRCEDTRALASLRRNEEAALHTFLSFLAGNHGKHLQVLRDRCLELWMERGSPDLASPWAFLYRAFGSFGTSDTSPELVRGYILRAIMDPKIEPLGPMTLPDILRFIPKLGYAVKPLLEPAGELLLEASGRMLPEECDWLVSHGGADVNATGPAGQTPLHLAAKSGCAPVVEVLLRHGASMETRDAMGDTAEGVARRFRRKEVVALLAGLREAEEERRRRREGGGILGGAAECDVMVGAMERC